MIGTRITVDQITRIAVILKLSMKICDKQAKHPDISTEAFAGLILLLTNLLSLLTKINDEKDLAKQKHGDYLPPELNMYVNFSDDEKIAVITSIKILTNQIEEASQVSDPPPEADRVLEWCEEFTKLFSHNPEMN
jgi:hypothetical protein